MHFITETKFPFLALWDNKGFCVQFFHISDKVQEAKAGHSCLYNPAISLQLERTRSETTNIVFS